ncbi:unnamed protein product [Scytosiphon promiscuus]
MFLHASSDSFRRVDVDAATGTFLPPRRVVVTLRTGDKRVVIGWLSCVTRPRCTCSGEFARPTARLWKQVKLFVVAYDARSILGAYPLAACGAVYGVCCARRVSR